MGLFPEKEPKNPPVKEVVEDVSPLIIERKEVVTPRQSKFTAQVTDDNDEPVIQTPETKKIEVSIPALSKETLEQEKKLSKDETKSWNASFLLRMIAKALHFGKKLVFKGK